MLLYKFLGIKTELLPASAYGSVMYGLWCCRHNDDFRRMVGVCRSINTYNKYRAVYGHLERFVKSHCGKAQMALLGIAAGILSAYMHNNTGECIFSLPSNGICNKYIGIIMHEIGIFKHITFHSARHTFATTVALSNGMSIEVISSLLGHKSIYTTQIYATVDRGIAAESMERLSENIDSLYSQIDTRREKSLIRVF